MGSVAMRTASAGEPPIQATTRNGIGCIRHTSSSGVYDIQVTGQGELGNGGMLAPTMTEIDIGGYKTKSDIIVV